MSRAEIEETHLQNYMLFLFDKGLKAKEATQTICDIYGDVLQVQKCYRWLRKFKVVIGG